MENDEMVMKAKPNPDDEVHHVDGIVELNHPAPYWWQMIYYISVVWAVAYVAYYLVGGGQLLRDELAEKLQRIDSMKVQKTVSVDEEKAELRAYFKDQKQLAAGLVVFTKNCVSCHSEDGGGGIGPNLADTYWINGDGSIDAILKTVREGVADKGMPPWGPILKREETLAVTAYVRTFRGKTPQKPKAPQGTSIQYAKDIE